jgi:ADP-ribose pyrophosphatase
MSNPKLEPLANVPLLLEVVEDLSPPDPGGFLRLVRRRLRAIRGDGTRSNSFTYDEVDRRALDAVVIVAHAATEVGHLVYLRSAVRPPVAMRQRARLPHDDSPTTGMLWELPAGLVEADEQSPTGLFRTAQRELLEELGFAVGLESFRPLGPSTFPTPGVIAERHFFFEVKVDPEARTEPTLDGSVLESLGEVRAVLLAEALACCRSGRIQDGKTELGLRRLQELLAERPAEKLA